MIQIAMYGKGGIGKSTVSANISYLLAGLGEKVLQIGCDPKHDSTRLLLDGKEQTTVLDYIRRTAPYDRRLEDIVLNGVRGIRCVEAGGPEPGIGCAGRGILSTFDTLKNLGIDEMDLSVKLYDVLGDVVCGGFAVPLRNEYADGVYLVTSGEFMSVYAANNILKGIRNFDKGIPRVAGIILNCRGMENESDIVERFAEAVRLPIVARVPRSGLFALAESAGRTLAELYPESDEAKEFGKVASHILSIKEDRKRLLQSRPLDDAQMGRIAKGERVAGEPTGDVSEQGACRICMRRPSEKKTTAENRIVPSCATAGAVYGCISVSDAVTIVHGPRSCAHIMSALKSIAEIKRGDRADLQSARIRSTEMDDTVSVFGGAGSLEQRIRDLILEGHKNFFVVTSCVSGIIGDNTIDVVNAISNEHPEMYFRVIEADGNITGDMGNGYVASADAMLDAVDRSLCPENMTVNIIAERYLFRRGGDSDVKALGLFSELGIRVNCRFMYDTTLDSIKGLRLGKMTFMASDDAEAKRIADLVEARADIRIEEEPLPVGLGAYRRFHERVGKAFGIEGIAKDVYLRGERRYLSETERLRKRVEGKRVLIENRYTADMDWLLELLSDLGMIVIKIGMGPRHIWKQHPELRYGEMGIPFAQDYSVGNLMSDISELEPDIVLTDSGLTSLEIRSIGYIRPDPGIEGVLEYGRRLANLMSVPVVEGWRRCS